MADLIFKNEISYPHKLNDYSSLVDKLFFACVFTSASEMVDVVSGSSPDIISSLGEMNGEFYEQNDVTTLDPTVWNIPYPYAALNTSDDSSFTFHWRIRIKDISSTAAVFWEWGTGEISLKRYLATVQLGMAAGSYTIATGVNVGDIFDITLTRDSSTNDFEVTVNGVKSLVTNFSYTTLNNSDAIKLFNEADQRGEGISHFYAWVDRKLTDEEIATLEDNPYEMFETSLDSEKDTSLKLAKSQDQQVQATTPIRLGSGKFEIELSMKAPIDNHAVVLVLNSPDDLSKFIIRQLFTTGRLRVRPEDSGGYGADLSGANTGVFGTAGFIRLKLEVDTVSGNLQTYVNGALDIDVSNVYRIKNMSDVYLDVFNPTCELDLAYLKVKSVYGEWFYSFNRPVGSTEVPDLHGSSNNFSLINSPNFEYNTPHFNSTVGTGRDYSDIIAWHTARASSTSYEIGEVYENQELTTDFDRRSGFTGGFKLLGMGSKFKGDLNDPNVVKICNAPSYAAHLIDDRTGKGTYENLLFESTLGGEVFTSAYSNVVGIKNCGILVHGTGEFYLKGDQWKVTIRDCVIKARRALYAYGANTVNVIDSILVSDVVGNYGGVRIRDTDLASFTNTLIHNLNSGDSLGTYGNYEVTGSNNITNDNTAPNFGIGFSDPDLETRFVDPVNNNYQIKSTEKTNFEGQGWNGSDIASWAYEVAAPISDNVSVTSNLLGTVASAIGFTLKKYYNAYEAINPTMSNVVSGSIDLVSGVSGSYSVSSVVIKEIPSTSSVSVVSGTSSAISIAKDISTLIASAGSSNVSVLAKKLAQSIVTANSNLSDTEIVEKLVASGILSAGNISTTTDAIGQVEGAIVSAITGSGDILTKVQKLSKIVTAVTAIDVQTTDISKQSDVPIFGEGAGSGSLSVSKLTGVSILDIIGSSGTELEIQKTSVVGNSVSSTPTTSSMLEFSKLSTSSVQAEELMLLDIEKNSAAISSTSIVADTLTNIFINKSTGELSLVLDGDIVTTVLGNFEDNNVVLIDLKAVVKDPNIHVGTVVRDNNIAIEVRRK